MFNDIRLERLGFSTIVVNRDLIGNENYYRAYTGSLVYTTAPISVTTLNTQHSSSGTNTFPVSHIVNSNYMMTFAGWNTSNPATIVSIRWTQTIDLGSQVFRLEKNNGINAV